LLHPPTDAALLDSYHSMLKECNFLLGRSNTINYGGWEFFKSLLNCSEASFITFEFNSFKPTILEYDDYQSLDNSSTGADLGD
jgi:hypothetical protein